MVWEPGIIDSGLVSAYFRLQKPLYHWQYVKCLSCSLGFRFEQAQEKIYDYEDILEEEKETQKDPSFETIYEEPPFTRLKPDSTYRI